MAREKPAFILKGVTEGDVGDVMQQSRNTNRVLQFRGDIQPTSDQVGNNAVGHGTGSDRVVEAGMQGAWIDQVSCT